MSWRHELWMAARRLAARPAFSLMVMLVLGFGLASAIFGASALDHFVLRPLPFPEPDRLLWINAEDPAEPGDAHTVSEQDLRAFRDGQQSLAQFASWYVGTANLNAQGTSERLSGAFLDGPLLELLGVRPQLGRTFVAADFATGAAPVVLLGHAQWRERFAADPLVLGRIVRLNGQNAEVIGIMPAGFGFPHREQLWTNAPLRDLRQAARTAIGRIRDGATLTQVEVELDSVLQRNAAAAGETPLKASVAHFAEGWINASTRSITWILCGIGVLTLMIAGSNAATLLLARASSRQPEFALRAALGAGRGALMRGVLGEAVWLAAGALLLALLLATWFAASMLEQLRSAGDDLPYFLQFGLDYRMFGWGVVLAMGGAMFAGIFPALHSAQVGAQSGLRGAGKSTSAMGPRRLLAALVVLEVALCLLLLTGGAVMTRHVRELEQRPLGADVAGVLTARVGLFAGQYPDAAARAEYRRSLQAALLARPEFSAATLSDALPGFRASWTAARREQRDTRDLNGDVQVYAGAVDSQFLDLYRIRLEQGRALNAADRADSALVAVIDRRLAESLFPDGDALGRTFVLDRAGVPEARTIVGIHAPVQMEDLDDVWRPSVFVPLDQADAAFFQVSVRARPGVDAATQARALQDTVVSLDPDTPAYFVEPMESLLAQGNFGATFLSRIFLTLAGVGLLLAGTGLFGVLAFAVAQRQREFGVHLALGARPGAVLSRALQGGLWQVLLGVLLGALPALGFAQLLGALLRQPVLDVWAVALALLVIVLAGVAAAVVPAVRVLRTDPMVALRTL